MEQDAVGPTVLVKLRFLQVLLRRAITKQIAYLSCLHVWNACG